ncbi:MAG: FAD-dependent oxidoreductase [Gammaproteobacteria bacterium]|nr:FAD-dependent oxidoreductase [Gammaproteobacteria bacterium]
MYDLVIIGAGPAGLTAAYELRDSNKKVLVLDKKNQVGGLAETKVFGKYRYDIGPHRFFTKNKEVYDLFLEILGDDAVEVNRKTRILFKNSYFDYPLTPVNALFGLGVIESILTGFSYIFARIKSYLKFSKINNFEDWVVDKFGKKLFNNFFKNYTEKVWGIDCSEIGSDWAAQRIKGLSLSTAIKFALFPNSKKRPKTLVDKFYYPKLGAGMLWEKFEDSISKNEIEVRKESKVSSVELKEDVFNLTVENSNAALSTIKAKNIFFSNPLLEFINIYKTDIPSEVVSAANSLNYRNHISVHITIDKKLFDDNWIYIHSPDLKMARIADFTNFSEFMSNENTYPLTLEYFCFENDELWTTDNKNLIEFALSELMTIFEEEFNVVHSAVTRNPKAYPVIKTGYEEHIKIIKNWLETLPNITAIGRSGMFKYNNQDHAMATGLYAARNYLGLGNYDPWEVNVDGEYHEEISGD